MDAQTIAQWVFGIFVGFSGILAIGKLLTERDEARGYCNIHLPKKSKRAK